MLVALDASVVIAALLSWHERHELARALVEDLLEADTLPVVPLPALIESYAVMTRLPAPHRVAPNDAKALLVRSFCGAVDVIALGEADGWSLLETLAEGGVAGGRTYDAQIAACAAKRQVKRLITFNDRDFRAVTADGIEVHNPSG